MVLLIYKKKIDAKNYLGFFYYDRINKLFCFVSNINFLLTNQRPPVFFYFLQQQHTHTMGACGSTIPGGVEEEQGQEVEMTPQEKLAVAMKQFADNKAALKKANAIISEFARVRKEGKKKLDDQRNTEAQRRKAAAQRRKAAAQRRKAAATDRAAAANAAASTTRQPKNSA